VASFKECNNLEGKNRMKSDIDYEKFTEINVEIRSREKLIMDNLDKRRTLDVERAKLRREIYHLKEERRKVLFGWETE
jgi:hypothetical protein